MTKFNESQWFLQLRRRKCFNQTEFGELLGVSQSTVAEIEAGKRQLRLSEFLTIVRELDLNYDEYPIILKRHQIIDKLIDIISNGDPNHRLVKLRNEKLNQQAYSLKERKKERKKERISSPKPNLITKFKYRNTPMYLN